MWCTTAFGTKPEPLTTQYHFRTDWRFSAPPARVWKVVMDLERYPSIWRDFPSVRLVRGDGRSVGSAFACVTRGSLPYSLRYVLEVVHFDEPRSAVLRSSGDLVGTGRWEFSETETGTTLATYYWDVATTRPVLNLIAPLTRRYLERNHTAVMDRGYKALRPLAESSAPAPA
jgi:polyketide cyclase/dehydrase/lipid transport protein